MGNATLAPEDELLVHDLQVEVLFMCETLSGRDNTGPSLAEIVTD
jgi:hypothetical protein